MINFFFTGKECVAFQVSISFLSFPENLELSKQALSSKNVAHVHQLVQKHTNVGIVHFFFNPDHGHTRSESTRQTLQERIEVLVPNQLILFRAIDWAREQNFEPGTATLELNSTQKTFYD